MTWTPFASDFSRYLPRRTSHSKVVLYTAGDSFLALSLLTLRVPVSRIVAVVTVAVDSSVELYNTGRRFEWGFFAWIGGCLVAVLFWDTELLVGRFAELSRSVGDLGFLAGILGAGVLYMLMYKMPVPTGLLRTRKAARQQAEAEAAAEAGPDASATAPETKPATELEG